jgi:hypothetical protein
VQQAKDEVESKIENLKKKFDKLKDSYFKEIDEQEQEILKLVKKRYSIILFD